MTTLSSKLMDELPKRITEVEILNLLKSKKINWNYISIIKEYSNLKDDLISDWLNISVKTFRKAVVLKDNTKEQIVLLISLFKYGVDVFGSTNHFYNWLTTKNFFLDNDSPIDYPKTISGIRLIEERLTGIEYGDNV